jgi:hypothetical protein
MRQNKIGSNKTTLNQEHRGRRAGAVLHGNDCIVNRIVAKTNNNMQTVHRRGTINLEVIRIDSNNMVFHRTLAFGFPQI